MRQSNLKMLHWLCWKLNNYQCRVCDAGYRKIPKISPSMYKPLQIKAPQTSNAKTPPLNPLSKYKPPEGLYLENCPQIQSKTKQKR